MLFEQYDPLKVEPEIINYLEQNKILSKLKDKNKQGKKFSFLQGPPYTSGKVHLGTAWNTSLKDLILRYKRSQGFNVWDRNGYDVHGLPTEHKVMAKFDLKTKEDIIKLGLDKFVTECEDYAKKTALVMDKDFQRVGCSFDYNNPYMA
ncbi:class I tRNA ligase family protein, partial [Candidatus Woesearchaeota archaeon]|nr:class I tRNA ligase family protein [Candidatus Woesearchaeota archaeon]